MKTAEQELDEAVDLLTRRFDSSFIRACALDHFMHAHRRMPPDAQAQARKRFFGVYERFSGPVGSTADTR